MTEYQAILLNPRAQLLLEQLLRETVERRIETIEVDGGGLVLDAGVHVSGGIRAGLDLARISTSALAEVTIAPGEVGGTATPMVQVFTDHPVAACLASQYAGWQLSEGDFFAMGSGPMRAAAGSEALFDTIGYREDATRVVGVLEGRAIPTPEIVRTIAEGCTVQPSAVSLLIAPTASVAGSIQVVARSAETALHKLAELQFDLTRIQTAYGIAPLPPIAADDLSAIGRTNDAILYGGRVVLEVTGDDESLRELGPKVPSGASEAHGRPFGEIFASHNYDFYAVDPHLFSPAEITFRNVDTGKSFAFGHCAPDVLKQSFGIVHS